VIGLLGLVGTFLPLLVTASSSWGPLRGRRLWTFSLGVHLISWCCFALVVGLGFFGKGQSSDGHVLSPVILAQSLWSEETSLLWAFPSAALCLAACSVMVSFHFIARSMLEGSRASVAGLAAYLTCMLGVLGSNHPLMFSIFLAGSLVPRLVFTGMDVGDGRIDSVKESAFLSIVALLSVLVSVLAFAAPFRDSLSTWFMVEGAGRIVLPGSIGMALMLLAAAISAGIFPFHGNARRIFQMRSMERAVPLSLQPIFGFVLLFKFGPDSFPKEFHAFSSGLLGLFSVGVAYSAIGFLGSRSARDRVFWLQQVLSSFIAVGFFSLSAKGWHGAQVLLFFQSIAVPFLLLILACHERRASMLPLKEISRFPAFALSTALATLFALLLPVSLGFYGVLLVTWSLVGIHQWPLPFVILSMPLIAFAGVRIMYFRLGDLHAPVEPGAVGFHDLQRDEIFAILPIGLTLFVLGLVPQLLMGPIGVSVAATMSALGFKD
jgi:NADH:ubiquinone oxidoreductase subunit 4 (subunit M)